MSEFTSQEGEARSAGGATASVLAAIALIAGVTAVAFQYSSAGSLRGEVQQLRGQVASLHEAVSGTQREVRQAMELLRRDVDSTTRNTADEVEKAKRAARLQAELVASRLVRKDEEQRKQLAAEISQIKSATDQASANLNLRLTDISAEVGGVRTEVSSTRSEVQNTTEELRRVTGDLGLLSGRIATNARELATLRQRGERNYYEFRIPRTRTAQKVADIRLILKKTDPKRSRFTVELLANDKRLEKKDRTINEPVQFYASPAARQPYELVVNEVTKDAIVGYLSTPRITMARN